LRRYAPAVSRRAAGGLSKPRLQRVTDYIRGHLTQDLALAELAEIANVSPSHFKALFKQAVGLPVHQYVIRSRVDFAIDLLRDGKLPLSDVALQAGFANQSHMARCMRRVAGVTPGAVRDAL
jgi:AraC family transcriptional regulator